MTSKFPFPFLLDELFALEPRTKPMFGAHGVYVGGKIVFIVRNKESHPEANGIWFSTKAEFHESLRKEIPSMHSVFILSDGKKETDWQMIHIGSEDFERDAFHLCELVKRNDPRIGSVPKQKKKKKK